MLLGYCFEPSPCRRALGTAVTAMTIGLSKKLFSRKKADWREKTRLTSPEVRAVVASKT